MWGHCGGIAKEKKKTHEEKTKELGDASPCCTPDNLRVISGTYVKSQMCWHTSVTPVTGNMGSRDRQISQKLRCTVRWQKQERLCIYAK